MKKVLLIVVTACLLLSVGVSYGGVSIGGKVWYANVEDLDPALLWGATASTDLGESGFWISGMFLTGEFKSGGTTIETMDTEAVLGYRAGILDLGVGMRYATWELGEDGEAYGELVHYGPMVYAGAGDTFGDNPFGWYVSGSYMFLDMGDLSDVDGADTLEHWNVEGGLFVAWDSISATVGYRYKKYIDWDLAFDGVAGSVSLRF